MREQFLAALSACAAKENILHPAPQAIPLAFIRIRFEEIPRRDTIRIVGLDLRTWRVRIDLHHLDPPRLIHHVVKAREPARKILHRIAFVKVPSHLLRDLHLIEKFIALRLKTPDGLCEDRIERRAHPPEEIRLFLLDHERQMRRIAEGIARILDIGKYRPINVIHVRFFHQEAPPLLTPAPPKPVLPPAGALTEVLPAGGCPCFTAVPAAVPGCWVCVYAGRLSFNTLPVFLS